MTTILTILTITLLSMLPVQENVVIETPIERSAVPVRTNPPIEKHLHHTQEELIDVYIIEIAHEYEFDPNLVASVIHHESRFNPDAKTGDCLGLMQVSSRWHRDRAKRLGVSNFYDPRGNILLGVDYLAELRDRYKDMRLVLMLYNMNHKSALAKYKQGIISDYAIRVLQKAENYKEGERVQWAPTKATKKEDQPPPQKQGKINSLLSRSTLPKNSF